MQHHVHIYQTERSASMTTPAQASASFTVEADTHAEARRAAVDQLAAGGHTVRSLSFLVDGGMAAVVTSAVPSPTPANVRRALRGR